MQHDFILVDRSGSMDTLWKEALGSVNAYVKKLADDHVDTGVTLAVFDDENGSIDFTVIRDRIIPSTWRPVTDADAMPRGMTPLNDAVGKVVALANAGNYEKVAIIIMTDGLENSSKELRVDQAKKLLDDCRAKGWQVIFLGANFDNVQQATSYGTAAAQTVRSSKANLTQTMGRMGSARAAYASGEAATISFSDEEKAEAEKE